MTRSPKTAFHLLLVLMMALPATTIAQHTLVLDNGDRLTGQLTRIEAGQWVFRYGGANVRIAPSRVAAFEAPEPIGVRLSDGTIAAATVAGRPGGLLLTLGDGGTREVVPTDLAAVGAATDLDSLAPQEIGLFSPFLRFWGARGSLGFSDKSGNSRARGISTSLEIERRTAKDRLRLTAGLTREQSRNSTGEFEPTVSKYYGTMRADVYVTPRLFGFVETRQERDRFQDIDLRSVFSGGAGVQLLANPNTDLRLSGSAGARLEQFTSGGHETVAVLNTSTAFQQHLGPATVDAQIAWSPNLEDVSDYQLRSEAALTMTVYRGLGFRLGLLSELDSRPRPGVRKHDLLVTTTVTYSIGR